MEPQKYAKLYEEEKHHWWFLARRKIISHLFWNKRLNLPKNPSIFSIGTSTGAELEYLSQFGKTTGIDICDDIVEFNRNKGLNAHTMDITTCTLPDNSFDIVFAMDVFEHIQDDKGAYAQAIRVLKPGGYLIATVPAHMHLWSQHDVETGHVRRYTKKEFKELLKTQNASVLNFGYYNFFLYPLLLATRKAKVSPDAQKAVPNKLVNTVLNKIFSCERFFLKWARFPTGVSLFAVVRKNH